MLNCKLHVVVLFVGECDHMGLKGFRGLPNPLHGVLGLQGVQGA